MPFPASSAIFISLFLIILTVDIVLFFKMFHQFFENFIGCILIIFIPLPLAPPRSSPIFRPTQLHVLSLCSRCDDILIICLCEHYVSSQGPKINNQKRNGKRQPITCHSLIGMTDYLIEATNSKKVLFGLWLRANPLWWGHHGGWSFKEQSVVNASAQFPFSV